MTLTIINYIGKNISMIDGNEYPMTGSYLYVITTYGKMGEINNIDIKQTGCAVRTYFGNSYQNMPYSGKVGGYDPGSGSSFITPDPLMNTYYLVPNNVAEAWYYRGDVLTLGEGVLNDDGKTYTYSYLKAPNGTDYPLDPFSFVP